jgi:hypothetical protein
MSTVRLNILLNPGRANALTGETSRRAVMTNPPNRPRDDRRMHEGEKPGIGEKRERGEQEEVRLDRDRDESGESSTTDREQESALGGDVANRSKA